MVNVILDNSYYNLIIRLKDGYIVGKGQYDIDPLKTKRRPLYLKTQSVRAVNTFHLDYKNQSVYTVSCTSRCLFLDKYKTHKY